MKKLLTLCLLCFGLNLIAQTRIEWTPSLIIDESSFQAKPPAMPDDGMQQYYFSCNYELNFQMLNLQFTFTKNFNAYVEAFYAPSLSWKEAGDMDEQLFLMSNLQFDLVELYARKCRKRMYESKKVSSNVGFFSVIVDQINDEYTREMALINSEVVSSTDPNTYLRQKNDEVNTRIEELFEFCKQCKPTKKKK